MHCQTNFWNVIKFMSLHLFGRPQSQQLHLLRPSNTINDFCSSTNGGITSFLKAGERFTSAQTLSERRDT